MPAYDLEETPPPFQANLREAVEGSSSMWPQFSASSAQNNPKEQGSRRIELKDILSFLLTDRTGKLAKSLENNG
jgi:hypothetical protein